MGIRIFENQYQEKRFSDRVSVFCKVVSFDMDSVEKIGT